MWEGKDRDPRSSPIPIVLVSGRQRGGRLLGSNALSVARQLWNTKPCGKEWVNPAGGDLDSEIFPNSLWLVAGY